MKRDPEKGIFSVTIEGDLDESMYVYEAEIFSTIYKVVDPYAFSVDSNTRNGFVINPQRGKPFNKRKATTDHWYSVAVGSSECQISIDLVNKEHKIRVGLWITDNKERFDYMKQHKTEIEAAMGMALSWERLDNKKSSLICTYIKGLDFKNQENYPELMNKSIDLVVKMRDVLKEYVLAEL